MSTVFQPAIQRCVDAETHSIINLYKKTLKISVYRPNICINTTKNTISRYFLSAGSQAAIAW